MERNDGVELVRLPKQERVYDREEVLGRDTASVFPSQAKKALASNLDPEAVKVALGAKKFISETELEEIKASRGLRVEDGGIAVDKSLAEQLAENKAKKDAEFQGKWKQMKTGKNRPLDADELDFMDSIAQQEAEKTRKMMRDEQDQLEEFKRLAAESAAAAAPAQQHKPEQSISKPAPKPAPPPKAKPLIKVKPKSASTAAPISQHAEPSVPLSNSSRRHDQEDEGQPAAKKAKVEGGDVDGGNEDNGEDVGLGDLLGGYGSSGSDDES